MDEMNPAFENFLNNMSRLGGTPRETTRRVSASSFLGKDVDIERRVNNNSKKISIIARILKSRRANTAGIEKSILDIKNTMSSIVQTLEAQEKFEYEKCHETQQQLENEKRRKRATATEKDKPVVDFFNAFTPAVIRDPPGVANPKIAAAVFNMPVRPIIFPTRKTIPNPAAVIPASMSGKNFSMNPLIKLTIPMFLGLLKNLSMPIINLPAIRFTKNIMN